MRKGLAVLVLFLPLAAVLALDYRLRAERFEDWQLWDFGTYAAAILESFLLWASLLLASARRRGWVRWFAQGAFLLLLTCALGGQIYFFEQYNAY
ncbi:MAG: hypothetical protein MK135_14190, partial [Polyangiaceae bacterium]|nr:hypothetical protein [Polyangiaceae bacterium]